MTTAPGRPQHVTSRRFAALGMVGVLALSACATNEPAESPTSGTGADVNQKLHRQVLSQAKDGVLTFAAVWEDKPRIYVEAKDAKTPVGFAPDLAAELAKVLGIKINWVNMQWPAQLPGVQSGAVDVLFPQVTITAEREKSVVDLIPFWQSKIAILAPAGNPKKLGGLGDACGLKMGAATGSTVVSAIKAVSARKCKAKGKKAIVVNPYQGPAAAVTALRSGTIDGWVSDTVSQKQTVDQFPDAFELVGVPSDEYPPDLSGFAVGKNKTAISKAVLGGFRILVKNGTYKTLLDKYGLSAVAIDLDQVVPNPMTDTPLGKVTK